MKRSFAITIASTAYSEAKKSITTIDDERAKLEFQYEIVEEKLLVTGMYTANNEITYDHQVDVSLFLTQKMTPEQ